MNIPAEGRARSLRLRCGAFALALLVSGAHGAADEILESRIVVVGASVSAGFRGVPLATAVGAAFGGNPRVEVSDLSDPRLFRAAARFAAPAVRRALAYEPDAVLALDYPFWFGYGNSWSRRGSLPELRLEKQAQGLALLEDFECPLILGDYPELGAVQSPSGETLRKLNLRLYEWAAARPNVVVLPVSSWMDAGLPDARGLTVGGETHSLALEDVIQPDGLHATRLGTAFLAQKALEALAASLPEGHPLRIGAEEVFTLHQELGTLAALRGR